MKVLVINGSPKGKNSITYQTIRFLQKKFPKDTFETIHAGAQIKLLERDMKDVCRMFARAELIVFVYPVYTFIAPSQLHRFIELLKEQNMDLSGKYAVQITTSKHFYDITAHRYIEDNCKDLGLSVLRGFSADMDDLLTVKGQLAVITYWNYVAHIIGYEKKGNEHRKSNGPLSGKNEKYHIVIVTDCEKTNERLRRMIIDFRKSLPYASHVVNLQDFDFRGGCLGCFHCAADGACVYPDGFDDFLRHKIQQADSIVYAFSIRDHSMGALFKTYDDRQFCNGHRTVTMGKPTAYLVDGELSREENLKTIIEGRSQVGGNFLAGVATNEGVGDSVEICADRLSYALEHRMKVNENFYGVGGKKIFRDLIFEMQGLMREDHRFYKENHFYDFPHKKAGRILLMYLVGLLTKLPADMVQMQPKMTEGMLAPYEKVIHGNPLKL